MPSSYRPSERAADKDSNPGSAWTFESLSENVLMGEQSFAQDHSVLLSDEKTYVRDESRPWRKARWWLMALSVLFAVLVVTYQIVTAIIPGFPKVRRAKGPRFLNWVLGRLVHPLWEIVREGVVTSGALDVIYNIEQILPNPRTWGERFIKFLLHQPDGQAVTNRLKITHTAIYEELERLSKLGLDEIRVASLACGSAQAMIEAISVFVSQYSAVSIRFWLVDLNQPSLDRARQLARDRGVEHLITFESKKLQDFLGLFPDGYFHLVEMVGFLDYQRDRDVVRYCNRVRQSVCDGGLFVGAMIGPNPWQFVVRWLVGWPLLLRRTPEKFRALLVQAWEESEVNILPDPHRIHTVSFCRKKGTIYVGGEVIATLPLAA